jgi:hypothetical protein
MAGMPGELGGRGKIAPVHLLTSLLHTLCIDERRDRN